MAMVGLLTTIALGLAEHYSPARMTYTSVYMLATIGVAWFGGRFPALVTAVSSASLIWMEEWMSLQGDPQGRAQMGLIFLNAFTRLASYAGAALITDAWRRTQLQLERHVAARTAALQQVVQQHEQSATQLRDTLERFRQVTDNISGVFWMTDATKNHMLYVSPGCEKLWRQPVEQLYASPRAWMDAIHEADRARVLRAARTKQVSGDYDEEYRVVWPDGTVRWIRDRAFPVRNERGEVYRLAGIAEDITERKEAVETLQRQKERLRLSLEAARMITWDFDPATGALQYSDNFLELTGVGAQEPYLTLEGVLQQIHPDDREAVARGTQRSLTENVPYEQEYRVLRPDGNWHWVVGKGRVVYDETGRPIRMLGVTMDIHARKTAEQELTLQARVLESMDEGVVLVGPGGVIRMANRALESAFGYEPGELVGQNVAVLNAWPPEETARFNAEVAQLAKRQAPCAVEYLNRRKDGSLFTSEARISLLNLDGQPHLISVQRDITQRRQAGGAMARNQAEAAGQNDGTLPHPASEC
jgi:two-component system, cell cycle sensor histidine kinase and response regulator CckA